jgi:PAP2 superfamily
MTTLEIAQNSRARSPHLKAILAGLSSNRISYAIALFCLIAAHAEAFILAVPIEFKPIYVACLPVLVVAFFVMIFEVSLEMVRLYKIDFRGALLPALWNKIIEKTFAPERVSNILHATIFISIYMMGFTVIKDLIPTARPFSWDPYLLALDQQLHFGRQPYEWLAFFLNHRSITYAINFNYNLWFFVMFGFVFWHSFAHKDNRLRQQFFVAFMLTWFIGTCVFGTIFSSVGPGFHGRLYPDQVDPFKPLLEWLAYSNQFYQIYSVSTMNALWESYVNGKGLISGISAMPSMHVGSSVILVLCARATGKSWLFCAICFFCAAIFIGSIHLGWHYAVDGYVGAAIAVFGWWLAGKIVIWDRAARGVV